MFFMTAMFFVNLIVPTLLEGSEHIVGTMKQLSNCSILKWVFMVQTILANRYNNHREL